MYGQCFYVLRGMLWYSDLADNRRFFVYIYIDKVHLHETSVLFYTLWKWYCWANSSNEKKRGKRKKKEGKIKMDGIKIERVSTNFVVSDGLKTTNNHRYVNYIRFSNSIYIKFILPFLSTIPIIHDLRNT